jgi:hypothetical protein
MTNERDAPGPVEPRDHTTARDEESYPEAPAWECRPSVVRLDAAGDVTEPQYRLRVALSLVASSCLEPPRAS